MGVDVRGKVSLDGKGWEAGLKQIRSETGKFADYIKGDIKGLIAGTFGAAAIYSAAKAIFDWGKEMKVAHLETRATYQELQVFEYQAGKVGAELGDVTKMLAKMTEKRAEAMKDGPDSEFAKRFAGLGVDFDTLTTNSPIEIFKKIQKQIASTGDATRYAADMVKIFGRTAYESNALFLESFESAEKKAKDLGKVVEDEVIERLNRGSKLMKENFVRSTRGPTAEVGSFGMEMINALGLLAKGIPVAFTGNADPNARQKAFDDYFKQLEAFADVYDSERLMAKVRSEESKFKKAFRGGVVGELTNSKSELEDGLAAKQMTSEERLIFLGERRSKIQEDLLSLKEKEKEALSEDDKFEVESKILTREIAMLGIKSQMLEVERGLKREEESRLKLKASLLESIEQKERRNRMEGMTEAEKLKSLEAERLKLIRDYQQEKDQNKQLKIGGELLDVENQISQLKNKKNVNDLPQIPSDSLVRVGNFLGSSGANTLNNIAKDQLTEAKRQTTLLASMDAKLSGGNGGTLSSKVA